MWLNILRDMLKDGKTMENINVNIRLALKYKIITQSEKIEIYATFLHEGYLTTTDLDTYITQGFITEQDKTDIIALEATM